MTTTASYAAADWGTSSFRIWLIGETGEALSERRSAEGMTTAAKTGFSAVLEQHLEAMGASRSLPVVICGMAGARQGWVEAGYLDTPAALSEIVRHAVVVPDAARDIRILPGLAQRDAAMPDVMRGEETQLLGSVGALAGTRLVCMPGTHSKWVRVADGTVERFSTFMSGELFDVVSRQSILSHAVAEAGAFDGTHPAFVAAVAEAMANPGMATNLLFTVRSGQLLHGHGPTEAKARLSGLMIGLEIAGATTLAADAQGAIRGAVRAPVSLVASGPLAGLYTQALTAAGLTSELIDADEAVRDGLAAAARALWPA
ncbi:2-dehydro-3-deoxygalactonokinase [Rhizobium sp. Leaf371]|uniref:2-dehydro-3-deoxygalactonokinase n=1 Tax=Rhizobium sp. Leaf371 TaxID=1736355 RepID=UPI000713398A|nr:2-dehydro-3-deoxygalactonokinase [Rhizobium sp. Leaf371]KQS67761.1 2-dehydro-3-deoxygalactonokinase [Rhizobium sp. Leaf371]